MSDTHATEIARPGAFGALGDDSRRYGRPKDPRLVPEMAEKVAAVRKRWDTRGASAILLTFDEMLSSLLEDCMSYQDIGIVCGVSRERIRQVHRDYFSTILPYRKNTGRKRVRTCTLVLRAEKVRELPLPEGVSDFAKAAEGKGLFAEVVVRPSSYRRYASRQGSASTPHARARIVRIGRFTIGVLKCNTPRLQARGSRTRLFHFNFGEMPCDYRGVWCGSPLNSWFLIPKNRLRKSGHLYIPEHPDTYRRNPRSDWIWQYREAWHLLKEEK